MSDTTLNKFLAQGTNSQRLAFTPSPPSTVTGQPKLSYIWFETDTGNQFMWNQSTSAWVQTSGTGTGNVTGPSSATTGHLATFADTTGKLLADGGAIPAGANPTATAGAAAVNGSATTFMRSDAAPAIAKASNTTFGIVEVDNTTITASSGVISAATQYTGPGTSVDSHVALFSGTSGKVLKDSGVALATVASSASASDLTAGTLAAARGGAGTISGALKGNGSGVVSQAAASDLSNGTTGTGAVVLASGPILTAGMYITNAAPNFDLDNSSAPTDSKDWRFAVDTSGTLHFLAVNDANTAAVDTFTIARTGTAASSLTIVPPLLTDSFINATNSMAIANATGGCSLLFNCNGAATNFKTWRYTTNNFGEFNIQSLSSTNASQGGVQFELSATPIVNAMQPITDNVMSLGASANRWTIVYATTGTINTSDAREKSGLTPLSPAELAAAKTISQGISTYQWLDAIAKKGVDGARLHVGVTSQAVEAAFAAQGLDAHRYGMFTYDEWVAKPDREDEVENPDGTTSTITTPGYAAGDRYGVRYEELAMFILAAHEQRLAALEAKMTDADLT